MDMDRESDIRALIYSPYDPYWPSHTLVQLYHWMQEDRIPAIFWRDGRPQAMNNFIRFATEPGRVVVLPLLCTEKVPTLDDVIGMVWVDEIELPHAEIHFWVRKKHWWRRRPQRAAHAVLEKLFADTPALHTLICRTNKDNPIGVKFMQQSGAHVVGELPNWYKHGETYHAAILGYISRNDVEERTYDRRRIYTSQVIQPAHYACGDAANL
jgi:RimJ/RimL family protein N-acetyltransferase